MKKQFTALILTISIILSGCSFSTIHTKDPVVFYYLCDRYQEELCCVIVSEEREASGHAGDLPYLLALYLMGSTNEEHLMPLPTGTRISTQITDGHIRLELSGMPRKISDIDFTLACACLTMTCLEITEAVDVTICDGEREIVMNRDSITLYDTTTETKPLEETQ